MMEGREERIFDEHKCSITYYGFNCKDDNLRMNKVCLLLQKLFGEDLTNMQIKVLTLLMSKKLVNCE